MQLSPDHAASLEFLNRFRPGGPWMLTAIRPDKKGIVTETLTTADDVVGFLSRHGDRNIYFQVNPATRALSKKAKRTDLASLEWLHIDLDPKKGAGLELARVEAREMLTRRLPVSVPPPTAVLFSGGGYQGFWRLQEPYSIDGDLARAQNAARWNLQLEKLFQGEHCEADNCHNIDRIMRVPGTINWPDATKIAKGRAPALAETVEFNDNVYPLTDFTPAPLLQDGAEGGFTGPTIELPAGEVERLDTIDALDEWGVDDRVKIIIAQGEDPDSPKQADNSRSAWLIDVLCQLARAKVPAAVMYAVITDPAFAISDSVRDKGNSADSYARRQIARAIEMAYDKNLAKMNERFAVVENIGGKCRIVEEVHDVLFNRSRLTEQDFTNFRNRFCHIKINTGQTNGKGQEIVKRLGDWWIDNKNRRQYQRIVFDPSRVDVPNCYNLWRGFAFNAVPGQNHQMFMEHLRENICGGNTAHYEYLLGWMARTVQYPATQGEVAVVLKGRKGTGKSSVGKYFGALFGRHFIPVYNSLHLVGNFNAHLRDCVSLFADEAFYAGDKQHESILKTLVTEDLQTIEAKHRDMEHSPNFIHLIMSSNSEWIVPAGPDERRYFVVNVSETRMQDFDYFAEMKRAMSSGGYESLLHELLSFDLSEFQVRRVPMTEALQDQKRLSLRPIEEWWYGCLVTGYLSKNMRWERKVPTSVLQASYVEFTKDFNIRARSSQTELGYFLRKMAPGIQRAQKSAGWFYMMPSLAVARGEWENRYGDEDWPPEEPEDGLMDDDVCF